MLNPPTCVVRLCVDDRLVEGELEPLGNLLPVEEAEFPERILPTTPDVMQVSVCVLIEDETAVRTMGSVLEAHVFLTFLTPDQRDLFHLAHLLSQCEIVGYRYNFMISHRNILVNSARKHWK